MNPRMNGAILSARHSFMPNLLGYCGPDANSVILEAIAQNKPSSELASVLRGFQGAYPYLRFLSQCDHGSDPFAYEVTEAYWIGNSLLEKVPPDAFYQHLRKRLSDKFSPEHLKSFFKSSPYASFPHHSLHVFNAFSTMGTVPDSLASGRGSDSQVGELMDKCRISWAEVIDSSQEELFVEYEPVVRRDGQLRLGQPVKKALVRQINGTNLMPSVKPGDWVSTHWGFACTVLSTEQIANLRRFTLSAMELANKVPVPD